MALKVTTWNVEHADRLIALDPPPAVLERRRRVRETIERVAPDVLCVIEGPKGERGIEDFCSEVLDGQWVPILLKSADEALGERDRDYLTSGEQWIWFLVRPELEPACRLQPPSTWQSFTGMKVWPVNYWGKMEATRHLHYRHPQVMIHRFPDGREIEFIGVHLKSKINQKPIVRDAQGNLLGAFVDEALEARVKLASEARNVRDYVAAKFEQNPQPGLVVMGDCNDGPGQDYFETQYLFFDLIGNLQGEVLLAERFFNHALFDYPGHLRWSAKYRDDVLGIPASRNPLLIDHILLSQALCRGQAPVIANEHAGQVEHEAFERANAGSSSTTRSSDHRPVSCRLDDVV